MVLKRLLFVAVLIVCYGFASASVVRVMVTDRNGGLSDVIVVLQETGQKTVSDESGLAVLDQVKPGQYTLVAVLGGYEKFTRTVDVTDTGLDMQAQLKVQTFEMGEQEVRGKRNKGKVTTQSTVRAEDLTKTSGGFMGDAVKTLQTMPGVGAAGSTFDSRMYIQGGSEFEQVASLDGVLIMSPNRWGGRMSMFNPNIVDSIDLYTAAYPAQFGQGMSGVMNVQSKTGRTDKLAGRIELGAQAELALEGPVSKDMSVFFNFRRTFYDFFANAFDGQDDVVMPYLWDGIFKFKWNMGAADTLTFLAYGSYEGMNFRMSGDPNGLEQEGDLSGRFSYEDVYLIGSLKYEHSFGSDNSMDIQFAATPHYGHYVFNNLDIAQDITVNEPAYQLSMNGYLNSLKGHKLQGGVLAYFTNPWGEVNLKINGLDSLGNYTNLINRTNSFADFYPLYGGAYAMENWEILPGVILQAGARGEYYNMTGQWTASPQAGLKWELTQDLDLFARGGIYNTFPLNMQYLSDEYGNPALQAERVAHVIGGVDYSGKNYAFRAEGFYKFYTNLITQDLDTNINYRNAGIREIYGFDVYLQKKPAKGEWLNGWLTYTYVHGAQKVTERSVAPVTSSYADPLNQFYVPGYLREHTISAILEATYQKNDVTPWLNWMDQWSIGVDFRSMSGKPYTPVTNFSTVIVDADGRKAYQFQYGEYNSALTPWQFKMDILFTIASSPLDLLKLAGCNIKSSSYFSIKNVLAYNNVTEYSYTVKDNQLQRVEVKDFGFMLLGGIKMEF